MVDRRLPHPLKYGRIIIDIGSGARPYGNVQIDLPPEESDKHHRGKSVPPTMFADAHHLPLRDKVVDRVLCLHILEHLKAPFHALEDIRRILRYSFGVPLENERMIRWAGSLRIEAPNPRKWEHERREHLYSWHPDTFKNIIWETGFKLVKYHADSRNHSVECVKAYEE